MKTLVAALLLALALPVHAEVPQTIGFTARLVDDKTGAEVVGTQRLTFRLFDAETGGTALWTEEDSATAEDGLVFVDLGATEPLTAQVLDGRKLFLEVTLNGTAMEPRVVIGSVPYAVRATEAANAATVGGIAADQLQKRITGGCTTGNFIIGINEDGSAACAPDLSGSGDITAVTAGNGLAGGGTEGNVTLSLVNCGQNEVLKFQGSAWVCATDANAGGDITGVSVGGAGGLSGGGTSGDVALSLLTTCASGQILKFNGSSWGCSADLDTNSGGTLTAVTTSGNSGLVAAPSGSTVALSLLTSCGVGQVLKFNGTAWGCANDIDTDTNAGGDVTEVVGGAGLLSTNQTGPIVTLDIGAGAGIIVGSNAVSLDTDVVDTRIQTQGDPRWVNTTGDTMSGSLNMGGNQVTNRGCPSGFLKHGATCVENSDISGLTFSLCANKCRNLEAHVCSSGEIRGAMQSGTQIGGGGVAGDWVDDMATTTSVFVINSGIDANNWIAVAQTPGTTTTFCRCCTDVE